MIPNSAKDFDSTVKKVFDIKNFNSLMNVANKIRIELGAEYDAEQRITVATQRSISVISNVFSGKGIWMRLVSWEENPDLVYGLFDPRLVKYKKKNKDNTVYYLYSSRYHEALIEKIINAIIEFDMGMDNGMNIRCLFVGLDVSAIINVYDDRGMDIVVLEPKFDQLIKSQFKDFIIP